MNKQTRQALPTNMRIEPTQRQLVKQSPVHSSYLTYSETYSKVYELESLLEQDYLKLLHFRAGVSAVEIQPFSILYSLQGRPLRYTPDFLVREDGGFYVDEVKSIRKADKPEFKRKAHWFRSFLAQYGLSYRVVTEREIYVGRRADNLRYLMPALAHPVPHAEFEHFCASFAGTEASMAEMKQHLSTIGIATTFIRRAVAHGLFRGDLTQPWRELQLAW